MKKGIIAFLIVIGAAIFGLLVGESTVQVSHKYGIETKQAFNVEQITDSELGRSIYRETNTDVLYLFNGTFTPIVNPDGTCLTYTQLLERTVTDE